MFHLVWKSTFRLFLPFFYTVRAAFYRAPPSVWNEYILNFKEQGNVRFPHLEFFALNLSLLHT